MRSGSSRSRGLIDAAPFLILPRREVLGHLSSVTVAPGARTIRGVPSVVVIGAESGLKETSAVNLDNVATVPKEGLRSFVGTVSSEVLEQVRQALAVRARV